MFTPDTVIVVTMLDKHGVVNVKCCQHRWRWFREFIKQTFT